MQYVVNVDTGVVHETVCGRGPMRANAVTAYEALPKVLLQYLPARLFCKWCCQGWLRMARAREAA